MTATRSVEAIHDVGEWLCAEECFSLAYVVARSDLEWGTEAVEEQGEVRYVYDFANLVVPPGTTEWLDGDDVETLEAAVWNAVFKFDVMWIVEAPHHRPRVAGWAGLVFRSQTEARIAQALERTNVGFVPNARGRWGGTPDAREIREPDFLVFSAGRVGVLEIDGGSHDGRAAGDHERDRLFRQQGIKVVERFDARECYAWPDKVVAEFLALLMLNG
jgi:hypothetical protein